MKREELATWLTEPNTNKLVSKKWVYDKTEADSVMDFLEYDIRIYQDIVAKAEARINELESKLQMEHRVGEDWCAKYWELRASQPKWISFKDDKPKMRQNVLVNIPNKELAEHEPTRSIVWCTAREYELEHDILYYTHWMPLPPPPTTEKSSSVEEG